MRCSVIRLCTQHLSRITLDRAGRIERGGNRLRVLEAHSFPHAGLLMASTSKVRCLQTRGRGRAKAVETRCRERERGRASNQSIELPDLRAHDCCLLALLGGARGRRSLVGGAAAEAQSAVRLSHLLQPSLSGNRCMSAAPRLHPRPPWSSPRAARDSIDLGTELAVHPAGGAP